MKSLGHEFAPSESAVLFGPYALKNSISQATEFASKSFAFNLGFHLWRSQGLYPDYLWITEEKVLRESLVFMDSLAHLTSCKTKILLPLQLSAWAKKMPSTRVEAVNLSDFVSNFSRNSLKLQAAAVWRTAALGYSQVYCLGFDHFFNNGQPRVFQNAFLPNSARFMESVLNPVEGSNTKSRVQFLPSDYLRRVQGKWWQVPAELCQANLFLKHMPMRDNCRGEGVAFLWRLFLKMIKSEA